MGKFLVRITTIGVSLYYLLCAYLAQFHGIDILDYTYTLMFELICVVYCFSEGNYLCKYLKFTMCGLFFADLITRLNYHFDFLSTDWANYIPALIIALGIATSTYKAIAHFIRVYKVNKHKNG